MEGLLKIVSVKRSTVGSSSCASVVAIGYGTYAYP
jgi:hypothetical protein